MTRGNRASVISALRATIDALEQHAHEFPVGSDFVVLKDIILRRIADLERVVDSPAPTTPVVEVAK
jgi:hypothetical protein